MIDPKRLKRSLSFLKEKVIFLPVSRLETDHEQRLININRLIEI